MMQLFQFVIFSSEMKAGSCLGPKLGERKNSVREKEGGGEIIGGEKQKDRERVRHCGDL